MNYMVIGLHAPNAPALLRYSLCIPAIEPDVTFSGCTEDVGTLFQRLQGLYGKNYGYELLDSCDGFCSFTYPM